MIAFYMLLLYLIYYFGAFTHFMENDYFENFHYPYEGDIEKYVNQLRNNITPEVKAINTYPYKFVISSKKKCKSYDESDPPIQLVYLVKSAIPNFHRRFAIRNSWGYENRFSDVPIKTVFLLGIDESNRKMQEQIQLEQVKFGDLVQANFKDTYFNNTIKTMIGFKWAKKYCQNARFFMFSDDDMYISTKNVLNFVRNPTRYPEYLLQTEMHRPRQLSQLFDLELPKNVRLFAGYKFFSAPHRHQTSKWYVSLQEYPFHLWPPYITAGAYILSRRALEELYYGSLYTKHFRFDDIYLGLIAKKINLEPFHSSYFYFYKEKYPSKNYKFLIASHGYENSNELLKVWSESRAEGNA